MTMKRGQLLQLVVVVVLLLLLGCLLPVADSRALGQAGDTDGRLQGCVGSCPIKGQQGKAGAKAEAKAEAKAGAKAGAGAAAAGAGAAPAAAAAAAAAPPAAKSHYSRISGSAASFTYNIYDAEDNREVSQLDGNFKGGVLHLGMVVNADATKKPQAPGIAELGIADLAELFKPRFIEIGTANGNWDVYYYLPTVGPTGNDRFGDAAVVQAEWGRRFKELGHKIEQKLALRDRFDKDTAMSDIYFNLTFDKDKIYEIFNRLRTQFEAQNADYNARMDAAYTKLAH